LPDFDFDFDSDFDARRAVRGGGKALFWAIAVNG